MLFPECCRARRSCGHSLQSFEVAALARVCKGVSQVSDAFQAVNRPQFIDMIQQDADALRPGCKGIVAQKRVQPNKAPRGAMEMGGCTAQCARFVALQAIGDQQNVFPMLKRYYTVDWSIRYGFDNTEFLFGINNIFMNVMVMS